MFIALITLLLIVTSLPFLLIYQIPNPSNPQSLTRLNRYVTINGWKFCNFLNNATFDSYAHLYAWNGSVASLNPTHQQVVQLIEDEAKRLYGNITMRLGHRKADGYRLRRASCYFSADSFNGMVNQASSRFLKHVDGRHYFPLMSYKQNVIKKRHYKIAYQILAHETSSFINLCALIERLINPDAIILVHVDKRNKILRKKTVEFIEKKQLANLVMQKTLFGVTWGHVSIVQAQLQGFFELLDLANWDYLINLSAYDWPLKQTKDIYEMLSRQGKANHIEYWQDEESSATRLLRPHITLKNYNGIYHPFETGFHYWPFPGFMAYKHHQWIILHREFVEFLRYDPIGANMLAFMEFAWIPDESYFASIVVNLPQFKVISNAKRFIRFEGGWHPIWVEWKHRFDLLPEEKNDEGDFFARKIDVADQPELVKWIDQNMYAVSMDAPCQPEGKG